MTDIVERLRERAEKVKKGYRVELSEEILTGLADEIERLRMSKKLDRNDGPDKTAVSIKIGAD